MAKQFNLKKFNANREKSRDRSKNGELNLIIPTRIDVLCGTIVEQHQKAMHPLFQKAEACKSKLALGCGLPFPKRTKPECEACL